MRVLVHSGGPCSLEGKAMDQEIDSLRVAIRGVFLEYVTKDPREEDVEDTTHVCEVASESVTAAKRLLKGCQYASVKEYFCKYITFMYNVVQSFGIVNAKTARNHKEFNGRFKDFISEMFRPELFENLPYELRDDQDRAHSPSH